MRLSLLAGSGALVPAAVAAAQAAGHKVQVLSLTPRDDLSGVKVVMADVGNPLGILWSLKVFRTTHIVMAGAITLSDKTREALATFASGGGETDRSARSASTGDATLSNLATSLEKMTGAKVIGVQDLAPGLLAPEGWIAGPEVGPDDLVSVPFALDAAKAIGRLDLGQAVVATGRRLIAAEDIGGTDALLRRVAELRAAKLTGDGSEVLVLAKVAKPGQPEFADLPAIGPDTIRNAAAAGVAIIAVETGRTLLIAREALVADADDLKVSVIGHTMNNG
jgi:DUF1009 family protein